MDWNNELTQALYDALSRVYPEVNPRVEHSDGRHHYFTLANEFPEIHGVMCASDDAPHILWGHNSRWTHKPDASAMYLYLKNLTREEVVRMVY